MSTDAFVLLSVHSILRILQRHHISKESNLFLSVAFIVQDSEPYDATAKAVNLSRLTLRDEGSLLFHSLVIFFTTLRAIASLLLISWCGSVLC
uniref:Uncharacterized protein n=1 Tax=Amphiprion ocellaris TaxID=80972 RepID=A0AAQ5ZWA5_AMPOC